MSYSATKFPHASMREGRATTTTEDSEVRNSHSYNSPVNLPAMAEPKLLPDDVPFWKRKLRFSRYPMLRRMVTLCRVRGGLTSVMMVVLALVFLAPAAYVFVAFHPELVDGRFRTYKAFYPDTEVGMT